MSTELQLRAEIVDLRSMLNAALLDLGAARMGKPAEPQQSDVIVTKNESGTIVAVTRQDVDGRILEVIAESTTQPATTLPGIRHHEQH